MTDSRSFVFIKRVGNVGNATTLYVVLNWRQPGHAR
jgi:hypothetical protein